jgi:hypothetical protein
LCGSLAQVLYERDHLLVALLVASLASCGAAQSGSGTGSISITIPEGEHCSGSFYADGIAMGSYPCEHVALSAGHRVIMIRSDGDGCGYGRLEIDLSPDEELTLDARRFR